MIVNGVQSTGTGTVAELPPALVLVAHHAGGTYNTRLATSLHPCFGVKTYISSPRVVVKGVTKMNRSIVCPLLPVSAGLERRVV